MAMPNMIQIESLLQDHRWHKVDLRPLTDHQMALCLRQDARLLAMDYKQFDLRNNDEALRARLHDMANGKGHQVERDRQPLDMKTANSKTVNHSGANQEHHEKTNAGSQPQNVDEATGTEPKLREDVTTEPDDHGKGNAISRSSEMQNQQPIKGVAPKKHMILPPCYCISCSKQFWDHRKEGFAELLDHEMAAIQVETWVANTIAMSQSIAQMLRQQEKSARRRWRRKSTAQRRQILAKVCPSLMTRAGLSNLLDERSPGQKRRQHTKPSRLSILISILILDELAAEPDLLFEHLHDRLQHPSQHFLADFMRVESAALYNGLLEHPYVFGTFQITNDSNYGRWRKWEDGPVHRFEAVAASYSMLVFESQSSLLDVLSGILLALVEGLTVSTKQNEQLAPVQKSAEHNRMRLPSLDEVDSLHTSLPQIPFCLEEAWEVALDQVERVSHVFQRLRVDNVIFTERMRASWVLRDAIRGQAPGTSRKSLAAYLILAEPHDQVVVWQTIADQLGRLVKARQEKRDQNGHGYRRFIHEFKTASAMLH